MQAAFPNALGPKPPKPFSATGKTAVVTGGALGIGYEVSRAFAKAGARVIMVNRKEEQGDEAIAKIKGETPSADVVWKHCDLGSLAETKQVFSDIASSESHIDYFVMSAGVNANQYAEDSDGLERIFAVNVIGNLYALNRVWPTILKSRSPAVTFVSSEMHKGARSDTKFASVDEINSELGPVELYGRSKLAQILAAKLIVEKFVKPSGRNVRVNSVHPGTVATDMQDQTREAYPNIGGLLETLALTFSRNAEQGAYSTIYAQTDPDLADKNGAYFSDSFTPGGESKQADDLGLADNLWKLFEQVVEGKLGPDALNSWSA